MKLIHIVGARPNFIKLAPVYFALKDKAKVEQIIVHTGQHYDDIMSKVFFDELSIPKPDINLCVGSASHAVQTAKIMIAVEEVFLKECPDAVIVYGDINSTMASAIVAAKLNIKVIHIEAGLRSFDNEMPEETNRIITDRIANLLLTPSEDGDDNLKREGVSENRIIRIGNVMIDTLLRLLPKTKKPSIDISEQFILLTLHRPSNVDDIETLTNILMTLDKNNIQIIFPVHPRTKKLLEKIDVEFKNLQFHSPMAYLEFLYLQKNCMVVVTDSGGIQEETTVLRKPCLTLRDNTERPITITQGSNTLIASDFDLLNQKINDIKKGVYPLGSTPELWDGNSGKRAAEAIVSFLD